MPDCGDARVSVVVVVVVVELVAVESPPEYIGLVDLSVDPSCNVFVALVENSSFLVAALAPTARSPRCRGSRCPRACTGQSCSPS